MSGRKRSRSPPARSSSRRTPPRAYSREPDKNIREDYNTPYKYPDTLGSSIRRKNMMNSAAGKPRKLKTKSLKQK